MEITKKDWSLFKEKIPAWQEAHMEKLTREYIKILQADNAASDRFWELEKRIKEDRKSPGVRLEMQKQEMAHDLAMLISRGIISDSDLDGFSQGLKEAVMLIAGR